MDAFASVTIVAVAGDNADAGLPGVKEGSRTRRQTPFTIKGTSLLQPLDPEWIKGPPAWADRVDIQTFSYLGDAPWCTRGWTFQEKIFSGRALIFTPGAQFERPVLKRDPHEALEFVVIGTDTYHDFYLVIVDRENEVAYRRGLVRIYISDWVRLVKEYQKWEMVCLG
jgi:hypothetical protein